MTATERVQHYKERQQQSGRKMVTMYLHPETINQLRTLAGRKPRGEIVERAIAELSSVSNNGVISNSGGG